jgi:hypothetical protein
MPMLLDAADRTMLMLRVATRVARERGDRATTISTDDLRAAVRAEAAALVAEGGFVFQDGALIRWPPIIDSEAAREEAT